jgi:hypothetical protein
MGAGPATPTGGGLRSLSPIAIDAISPATAPAHGIPSVSGVHGLEAAGLVSLAGSMGQKAAASSQGSDLIYRYCFPAGTEVLLADGTARAIETFTGGEWVLAAPDSDPVGRARAARVARVFHNAPARLVTVHTPGQSVRATSGHPFYAQGRGWIRAEELVAGDRLRTAAGGWTVVAAVTDHGESERVYNLEVAGAHTYFVGSGGVNDGEWILVHNQSGANQTIWDAIVQFFANALEQAKNWVIAAFNNAMNGIQNYLNQKWQEIQAGITNVVNWYNNSVVPVLNDIKQWAQDAAKVLGTALNNAGKEFGAGFIDPITAALKPAVDWIKEQIRPYTDALADMAGIIAGGLSGELYKNAGNPDWDYRTTGYKVVLTYMSVAAIGLGVGILATSGSTILGAAMGGGLLQGGMAGYGAASTGSLDKWGNAFAVGFVSGAAAGVVGAVGSGMVSMAVEGLGQGLLATVVQWGGTALVGAASGFVGAYTAQSMEKALGMRTEINMREVWAATAGGAIGMVVTAGITGGLTSGMMGSGGRVMCSADGLAFFAAHALGGAIGGAAGNLVEQWIKGDKFDWHAFGMAVAMGVVTGLAGAAEAWGNRACFAAGTPLLTPDGDRPIEQFRPGHLILSRSEFVPDGPVEVKVVEEVFVRLGRILHIHVGGQVIRTTAEHPFFVRDRGWLSAGELQVGQLLSGHDGQWTAVEDLLDTGEFETVYNLRVADFHTYFVGARDWGFSAWAHNLYNEDWTSNTRIRRQVEERLVARGLSREDARLISIYGASPHTDLATGQAIRQLARQGDIALLQGLATSLAQQPSLYIQQSRGGLTLLVGEGDFGLAASLISQPREAEARMVATSYDDRATVIRKYGEDALHNIAQLQADGTVNVAHGIDARELHTPAVLEAIGGHPDTIIFNFPFTGERAPSSNQALLRDFLTSANHVLAPEGSVLIATRDQKPYVQWALPTRAAETGFEIVHIQPFSAGEQLPYYVHRETLSSASVDVSNGIIHQLQRGQQLVAAGIGTATVTAQTGAPVSLPGQLHLGVYTVSIDSQDAPVSAEEQARLSDALTSLDASLASFGVVLQVAGPGMSAAADIHVHLAATSSIGSAADGVLGATVGNNITLIDTWNEYTGANPNAIGANQYDFQTVLTHELGHAIGLGHSTDTSSVMFASLAPGQARRGLTGADLTALAAAQASAPGSFANPLGQRHLPGCNCPACRGALRASQGASQGPLVHSSDSPVLAVPVVQPSLAAGGTLPQTAPPVASQVRGTALDWASGGNETGFPILAGPAAPVASLVHMASTDAGLRTGSDGGAVLLGGSGEEMVLGKSGDLLVGGFDPDADFAGPGATPSAADSLPGRSSLSGAGVQSEADQFGTVPVDSLEAGESGVADGSAPGTIHEALDLVFRSEF